MTEVALLQTPERTLMGALQESKGWGLYRNQRMGRGSQGSIHRIRGVLELTLKQNKAVGEGGQSDRIGTRTLVFATGRDRG